MNGLAECYDSDYHAWALHNAELLRQGRFQDADIAHIIEELQGVGRSQKRYLSGALKLLLLNLLKWQFLFFQRSGLWQDFERNRWRSVIIQQRDEIADLLEAYPHLSVALPECVANIYPASVRLMAKETCVLKETFPTACPYTLEQILDDEFYPGGAANQETLQ